MYRVHSLTILLAAAAVLTSCSQKLTPTAPDNHPPEIRLEAATRPLVDGIAITHTLRWKGVDPDGRIDHYLVAVTSKLPSPDDASWRITTSTSLPIQIERSPRKTGEVRAAGKREPRIVGVRAVDMRGATSQPAFRAYFDENIAPSVRITSPQPRLNEIALPTTFPVRFTGTDPDGSTGRPTLYKYIVLGQDSQLPFSLDVIRSNPDLLRQLYAPDFVGWTSVAAESSSVTVSGLIVSAHYIFAITAIDELGDYDPVFDTAKNVLAFQAGRPEGFAPFITIYNEMFTYTFAPGILDIPPEPNLPGRTFQLACPADVPITFHWYANAPPPSEVTAFRWVLDPVDVSDETPRRNKNDVSHWSEWNLLETSATVGPLHGNDLKRDHFFYVEALGSIGGRSRAIVQLRAVRQHATHELLIVNDTRRIAELVGPGGAALPTGHWPNAAELDTFLYARGGVPWFGYPTLSPRGVFAGYGFDTLGTRSLAPDLEVPIEVLMEYRHVIWITDRTAVVRSPDTDPAAPLSSLQFMLGRTNTLAAYVKHGGQLWLVGGGAGIGSTPNTRSNDLPGGIFVLTNQPPNPELTPGRFMFDLVHWRSEFQSQEVRFPQMTRSVTASGGIGSMLPATMLVRSAPTDPVPPLRTPQQFYNPLCGIERITAPNDILEDSSPSPEHEVLEPTLDTLMLAFAATPLPGPVPAMTMYRGRDNAPLIFSGFDLWSFRRQDIVQLVDAVLQGGWGMTRQAQAAALAPAPPSLGRSREAAANELRQRPRTARTIH